MRHNNIELVFLQEFVLRGKVAIPIFEFEIRESFSLVGYCASIPEYSKGVSHVRELAFAFFLFGWTKIEQTQVRKPVPYFRGGEEIIKAQYFS